MNVTVSTFFMEAYTFITIQYSTPARISEFRPGMPTFMMLVTSPTAKPAIQQTMAMGFHYSTFSGSSPLAREASSVARLRFKMK